MKVFLDFGHGTPPDSGAAGILNEEAVIKAVGLELEKLLKAQNIMYATSKVKNPSSVRDSLQQRSAQAKAFKADVFISIHANKGGGTGVEVYGNSPKAFETAGKIEQNIVSLGFNSRGPKKASFYVLNNTVENAVLVELFFLDSAVDVAKYTQVGPAQMAKAILAGALGSSSAVSATSSSLSETETFICRIKQYCAKKGYNTAAFLAVRLFETGGSLAAGYRSDQERKKDGSVIDTPAFGILQWTPSGCEPIQKYVGISEAHTRANNVAAYKKVEGKSRLEQLDLCFKYFDYWEPLLKKNFPQFDKASVIYQYVVTLSPGAGSNYKDGNGVTAAELVARPRFKALLAQAEGMLNGTIPVPNDDGKIHTGAKANAAHVKRMGAVIVNSNTCDVTGSYTSAESSSKASTEPGSKPVVEPSKGTKSLEDLLPMSLSFSIPEYPRLIGLKPGDVLILPPSATYRDWVVTSVNREFNQGLNKLTIQANRAISPKPFVQAELLTPEYKGPENVAKYYWEPSSKLAVKAKDKITPEFGLA